MADGHLALALTSDRSEIARLAHAVEGFGTAHRLVEDDLYSIQLLLDEIVINIIKHGYAWAPGRAIDVNLAIEGDLVTIRVEDDAPPFDPTKTPAPNLDLPIEERQIGGLGVHIVRSLAESMMYARVAGRNVLTITRTLAAPAGGR
jgi:anti-sigma regulatory factor (Ser/Thr protein kinase)